jgi:hypothetical protein
MKRRDRFLLVSPTSGISRGGHASIAAVGLQALLDRVSAGLVDQTVVALWLT